MIDYKAIQQPIKTVSPPPGYITPTDWRPGAGWDQVTTSGGGGTAVGRPKGAIGPWEPGWVPVGGGATGGTVYGPPSGFGGGGGVQIPTPGDWGGTAPDPWQKQVDPNLLAGQGPDPGATHLRGDPVQNQGGGYSADPYSTQTGGAVNFNYPSQWGEASKFYSQQLGGPGVGQPGEWDVGSNYLQDLIRGGGNATSGTDWWKAQQAMGNQRLQDQANQLAEQHGMLGTNFSSMLGHDITDATRRQNEDMLAQMSMLDYQGQEAAKQRLMEATSGLYNFGQGRAGLGLSNLANQFGAAGGLMNAGTAYSQLPLQVAGQMNQIGQGIYGQQAGQLQQQTPSWLQGALGYLGQTAGGVPQTYQPSIWEKLAGVASQIPGVGGSTTSLGYTPAPQTNPEFINRVLAGQPGAWDQGGGYTNTSYVNNILANQPGAWDQGGSYAY